MYCYKANFVLVNVDKNLVVGQNPLPFGQFPNFNWRQYCSASRLLHAVLAAMRTLPPIVKYFRAVLYFGLPNIKFDNKVKTSKLNFQSTEDVSECL